MSITLLQNLRRHLDNECEQIEDVITQAALDAVIRAIDRCIEDETRREALDAQHEKDFYRSETP